MTDGNKWSGYDRRKRAYDPSVKHERRSLLHDPLRFLGILEKIPLFRGLTLDQFKKILGICAKRDFTQDEVLCRKDEESGVIYILIRGELRVELENGEVLSTVEPVGIIGEMGVFTGDPRSATVIASSMGIVLVINKVELFNLFRADCGLGIQILMNVIRDLTHKLKKSNITIEELRHLFHPGNTSHQPKE